jgi:hypothetical protein
MYIRSEVVTAVPIKSTGGQSYISVLFGLNIWLHLQGRRMSDAISRQEARVTSHTNGIFIILWLESFISYFKYNLDHRMLMQWGEK